MKITWLGTASLLIETEESKILFDPYLRSLNKKLSRFPLETISDTDAIFITHPHFDHYYDLPEIMRYTTCPVYTNSRGIQLAEKMRFDLSRIQRIDFEDALSFGNLTVKAYHGRHVVFDKALVRTTLKRVFKGHLVKGLGIQRVNKKFSIDLNNDVFAFFVTENEKSVLIFGSANMDDQTTYPETDVLVYPYQGRSDILDYSMQIVKKISPKVVIADHFDDAFPPVSARTDVENFKERVEREMNIQVIIPTEEEGILI